MASRFIIDMDGCYSQINRVVSKLPGVAVSIIPPQELARAGMLIAIGYQSRRAIKETSLFLTLSDYDLPTDYAVEAADKIVEALESHILNCTRIRLHYSEFAYEFANAKTLVIFEAIQPKPSAVPTNMYWLDQIDEYYVGALINETGGFNH